MSTVTTPVIDRHSAVPYYVQLFDVLSQQVESGQLKPGERLPSESELGTVYQLSRATVRQTLQLLVSSRMAERVPNRGVFVRTAQDNEPGWMIQGVEGFLENALQQHQEVTTTVLSAGEAVLIGPAATALRVPDGTLGFELVRLRTVRGVPALHSSNYVPPPVADIVAANHAVLDGSGSLGKLYREAGYRTGGAHRTMYALPAPSRIAPLLNVPSGSPLMRMRSTSWDIRDRIYDYYETWVRTDVVPLEVRVDAVSMSPA